MSEWKPSNHTYVIRVILFNDKRNVPETEKKKVRHGAYINKSPYCIKYPALDLVWYSKGYPFYELDEAVAFGNKLVKEFKDYDLIYKIEERILVKVHYFQNSGLPDEAIDSSYKYITIKDWSPKKPPENFFIS